MILEICVKGFGGKYFFFLEAFISPKNSYATTIFKLREPEILPYSSKLFDSPSLNFAVVKLFFQLLETFTKKRSWSVAPWHKVQTFTEKRSSSAALRHKVL